MRIGVEAGEVLVDVERASGPRDRMLTGDAVNTAARLQTAAEPGHVIVGPRRLRGHQGRDRVPRARAARPKGKAEPVPAWDALRVKARSRGERPELGTGGEARRSRRGARRPEADLPPRRGRGPPRARHGRSARRASGSPAWSPSSSGTSRGCRSSSTGGAGGAWRTATRRTRRWPTRSRRSARSSRTTRPRSPRRRSDAAVRELFGDDGGRAADPRARGRGRDRARSAARTCSRRGGGSSSAWRPGTRWCSSSTTSTGPTTGCSTSSITWPTGRRGRSWSLAHARPELFEKRPTWGGGKRNAASIYLDPLSAAEGDGDARRPRRRARSSPISSARSSNAARATRCTSRRSSAS